MKVAIRVDASNQIGYGHVVRCLALADALGLHGFEVVFMCQQLPGDAQQTIREAGFLCWLLSPVKSIEDDADQTAELLDHAPGWDWLIVDHYALSVRWSRVLRSRVRCLMMIDDLANRLLDCDLLLDQNLQPEPPSRYSGLVPPSCTCLLGPEYALLRPEFSRCRQSIAQRSGDIRQVLVCFGGADFPDATGNALKVLLPEFPFLRFDVVVGAAYAYWDRLQALCREYTNVSTVKNVEDVAIRMANADLFIGSGGSMTWERASLALPGITISIAENQQTLCRTMAILGAGIDLGLLSAYQSDSLVAALRALTDDPGRVKTMSEALGTYCDGEGANRVVLAMLETKMPV